MTTLDPADTTADTTAPLQWLTPEDVARELKLSVRTVQNHAEKGMYAGAVRVGRQWRFEAATFRRGLLERMQKPAPKAEPAPARQTFPPGLSFRERLKLATGV